MNNWNHDTDAVFKDVSPVLDMLRKAVHITAVWNASTYSGGGYAGKLEKTKRHTTIIEANYRLPKSPNNQRFFEMQLKLIDASGIPTMYWFMDGVVSTDFWYTPHSVIYPAGAKVLHPDGYYQYSRIDELKTDNTIIDGTTRKTVQSIEVGKSHPDSWIRLHNLTYTDGSQDERWGSETVIVRRDYPEGFKYAQQS